MDGDFPVSGLPDAKTIHVWVIDLDTRFDEFRPPFDLETILSAEELERADRFRMARDGSRFRVCRGMMRLGLGWYLGKSPREIALKTGWWGKPYLEDGPRLHFNVAHSGRVGAMAFTTLGEVGIDAEALDREVEAMEIADRYFTPDEVAMLAALETAQEQSEAFFRLWTRKEAVLKAVGSGLQQGLDTVDVLHELVQAIGMETGERNWRVQDLQIADGFRGAVAAAPGNWSIRQWAISGEEAIARCMGRFPSMF